MALAKWMPRSYSSCNAERPDTSDAVAAEVLDAPAQPGDRAAEPSRTALGNMNTPAPPC